MSSSPPVPFIDLKRLEPGFHEALMDKFHRMTRRDELLRVLDGIEAAKAAGVTMYFTNERHFYH